MRESKCRKAEAALGYNRHEGLESLMEGHACAPADRLRYKYIFEDEFGGDYGAKWSMSLYVVGTINSVELLPSCKFFFHAKPNFSKQCSTHLLKQSSKLGLGKVEGWFGGYGS